MKRNNARSLIHDVAYNICYFSFKNFFIKPLGMLPYFFLIPICFLKTGNRVKQRLLFLPVKKYSGFAFYYRFQRSACFIGDNRPAGSHCFKRNNAKILFLWEY